MAPSQESGAGVDETCRQFLRISFDKTSTTFGNVIVLTKSSKLSDDEKPEGVAQTARQYNHKMQQKPAVTQPSLASRRADFAKTPHKEKSPGFPRGFPQPIR
jgi:hypothetical protein